MNNKDFLVSMHSIKVSSTTSKDDLLKIIAEVLLKSKVIVNSNLFYSEISEREELGSTHIGFGVVLIHSITNIVKDEGIFFYYISHPFANGISDELQPLKLVIVYAINSKYSNNLNYFKRFSHMCADDEFLKQLAEQYYSSKELEEYILC